MGPLGEDGIVSGDLFIGPVGGKAEKFVGKVDWTPQYEDAEPSEFEGSAEFSLTVDDAPPSWSTASTPEIIEQIKNWKKAMEGVELVKPLDEYPGVPHCPEPSPVKNSEKECAQPKGHHGPHHWFATSMMELVCFQYESSSSNYGTFCVKGPGHEGPHSWDKAGKTKPSGVTRCTAEHGHLNKVCVKPEGHGMAHYWSSLYKTAGICYQYPASNSPYGSHCTLPPDHDGPHSWEGPKPPVTVYDTSKIANGSIEASKIVNSPLYSPPPITSPYQYKNVPYNISNQYFGSVDIGQVTSKKVQIAEAYGMGPKKIAKMNAVDAAQKLLDDTPELPLPIQTIIQNLIKAL